MKPPLLPILATLALFTAVTVHAQGTPPMPPIPPAPAAPEHPSPPIHGNKAVITIDVDGHHETREIDLGKDSEISLGKNREIKIHTDADKITPRREKAVWLGVTPDAVSDDLRAQLPLEPGSGLILRGVVADGPAGKAGLQKNDVLTKLDDQLLLNARQLRTLVRAKHAGDTVRLSYVRRGQPGVAEVTLDSHDETTWTDEPGSYHFSFGKDDGADAGEEISKSVNAVVKNAMKNAATRLEVLNRAIVMDRNGKVVNFIKDDGIDVDAALGAVDRALHEAGIDDKTITAAKQKVADALESTADKLRKAQDGLKKAADGLKKQTVPPAGKDAAIDTDDE